MLKPNAAVLTRSACTLLLGMQLWGCKSTAKSSAKDDLSDTIIASLGSSNFYRIVPADQIGAYVPAATASDKVPSTLDGVWWEDAPTGQRVYSFHYCNWDEPSRTASLLYAGPGMYTQPAVGADKYNDLLLVSRNLQGIDYVFSDDKNAALQDSDTPEDDRRQIARPGSYIKWQDDSHWLSHIPNQTDTQWRRIIKPDGSPDTAFADYVKSFNGPVKLIFRPLLVHSPAQAVVVDLPAGATETILALDSADVYPTAYNIHVDAPFPVHLSGLDTGQRAISDLDGHNVPAVLHSSGTSTVKVIKQASDHGQVKVTTTVRAPLLVSQTVRTISTTLAPKTRYLLSSTDSPFSAPEGYIRLDAKPAVAFDVLDWTIHGSPPQSGDSYLGNAGVKLYVSNLTDQPVTTQLTYTPVPVAAADRGKIVLDGPPATGSLNLGGIDTYEVAVPAGFTGTFRVVSQLTSLDPPCCTAVVEFQAGQDLAYLTNQVVSQAIYPYSNANRNSLVAVLVAGGNITGPGPWRYSIRAARVADGARSLQCTSNQGKGLKPGTPCLGRDDGPTCSTEHDTILNTDVVCTVSN